MSSSSTRRSSPSISEDRYPSRGSSRRDVVERARCRQQEWAADEVWFPQLWSLIESRIYRGGSEEAVAAGTAALQGHFRELDRALGGRAYYCGDFSVADIGTFVFVSTAVSARCTRARRTAPDRRVDRAHASATGGPQRARRRDRCGGLLALAA